MEYDLDTYDKFFKYYIFINVINKKNIKLPQPCIDSEIQSQIENIISSIIETLVSIRKEIEDNKLFDICLAVGYPIKKLDYDKIKRVEGSHKNLTTNSNDPYNRFRFMPYPSIISKDKNLYIDDDLLELIINFEYIDNFHHFLIKANSNSYNKIINYRIFSFLKGIETDQDFKKYDFSYLDPF
jgi:hypothetical protein